MKKFKCAIFDLDGTLLNTIEDIANSVNCVLKRYSLPIHSIEEYKFFVGNGIKNLVLRSLPKNINLNENEINNLVKEVEAEYLFQWKNNTKPYEGINLMLEELFKNNIKVNVVSNKPHQFTKIMVDEFFKFNFSFVIGASEQFPKKPDPTAVNYIIDNLNFSTSEVAYIGDSSTDIKTAKNANIFSIGVSWGFRPISELKENNADVIVNHPLEILKYFI